MLQKLLKHLENLLFFIAGIGLLGSVGLAFAAVILRYVFNHSLEWIEEGARYLALFSALLVAGPVLRNKGHVALDIVPTALQGRGRAVHSLAVGLIALSVSLGISIWGSQLTAQTFQYGMRTGSLQFPQWLPYSIVPLGMGILALFSITMVIEAIQAMFKVHPSADVNRQSGPTPAGSGE